MSDISTILKCVYKYEHCFQGENGDLKNRGLKVDINHLPLGGKVNNSTNNSGGDNFPDSSIGEGMDITIQGANGHVKNQDNQSLKSYDSKRGNGNVNGGLTSETTNDRLNKYSDMSIGWFTMISCLFKIISCLFTGLGMDISIRGDGDNVANKEAMEAESGWSHSSLQFDEKLDCNEDVVKNPDANGMDANEADNDILSQTEIKHVEEVLIDPVDDVVVEDCCPEVCYRVCPCCIGDPDSPFWQLWYRHRLQVSRYSCLLKN